MEFWIRFCPIACAVTADVCKYSTHSAFIYNIPYSRGEMDLKPPFVGKISTS